MQCVKLAELAPNVSCYFCLLNILESILYTVVVDAVHQQSVFLY